MIQLKCLIVVSAMLICNYAIAQCSTYIYASTPSIDFVVHGDGTVTHNKTGLMWKVCGEGQTWSNNNCSGDVTSVTWQQALQIPNMLNANGGYAGYSDWRLPNIKELQSIIEQQCYSPSIESTIFPSTASDFYWSSSPYIDGNDLAWGIYFSDGHDYGSKRINNREVFYYGNGNGYHARLVRGGQ